MTEGSTAPGEPKPPTGSSGVPSGRLCTDGWITTYLKYTTNQASPLLFHKWTAVSVLAAVLRRNIYIDRGGYYTLYPNLYTVLVAPTGRCMKSTAASIGVDLLRNIEGIKIVHEKITPEGLISYLGGEMGSSNGHKSAAAFVKTFHDKNVSLSKQCNCYIYAPELSVFLGGVSYTAGLIELLTSLYEGKKFWEYRTKTRGEVELFNVNINLFGASNPEWLAKGFSEDAFGGGFMGRTIYIFQSEGKKVAWPMKPPEMEELKARLLHDLLKISQITGEVTVSKEARDFYTDWYIKYSGDFSGRMAGYYERKPDHILKLAMILSISRKDSLVLGTGDIKRAIEMLDEVEQLMPQAFAYIGATNEARVSQHIIETINGAPNHFISYRRLLAALRHMLKGRKEFDEIMDTLISSGQVRQYQRNNTSYFTIDNNVQKYMEIVEAAAEEEARKDIEAQKATEQAPKNIKEVVEKTLKKSEDKV